MTGSLPKIAVVLPACNEEPNIGPIAARLAQLLGPIADWELVFVDDGSSDRTLQEMRRLAKSEGRIRYMSLVRNFGHQIALRAGLDHARGDAVILMDCDFEHPPELVPRLIMEWGRGAKVVLTQRQSSRRHAGVFKRLSSRLFYVLFESISDVHIDAGSADFMLLDRTVVETIRKFENQDVFLRGLVRWLGYKAATIPFEPGPRRSGSSKYSTRRMLDLAVMGIVAHSVRPLRIAIYLSFAFALFGVSLLIYSLISFLWIDRTVVGWTSIMSAMAIFGAGHFLVLGILGEYLGRAWREVRRWPAYVVAETEEPPTFSLAEEPPLPPVRLASAEARDAPGAAASSKR
jgi:dolichol-phosphate mannosyltransferase